MDKTAPLPAADVPDIRWNTLDPDDVYLLCEAIIACSAPGTLRPLSEDDITTMAERIRAELTRSRARYHPGNFVLFRSRDGDVRKGVVTGKPMSATGDWEYRIVREYRTKYGVHVRHEEWAGERQIIDFATDSDDDSGDDTMDRSPSERSKVV